MCWARKEKTTVTHSHSEDRVWGFLLGKICSFRGYFMLWRNERRGVLTREEDKKDGHEGTNEGNERKKLMDCLSEFLKLFFFTFWINKRLLAMLRSWLTLVRPALRGHITLMDCNFTSCWLFVKCFDSYFPERWRTPVKMNIGDAPVKHFG